MEVDSFRSGNLHSVAGSCCTEEGSWKVSDVQVQIDEEAVPSGGKAEEGVY